MKKITLLFLIIASSIITYAQNPLPKGKAQINAGLGLSSYGVPLYFGLDYGVHQDITVGGEISFRSFSENYKGIGYSQNVIGISGNGNYHFNTILNIPKEWDFYAGLNLGFYLWNTPNNYPGSNSSGLNLGLQVGGRYYFTQKVGINLELGGGNVFSSGKLGVTIKL